MNREQQRKWLMRRRNISTEQLPSQHQGHITEWVITTRSKEMIHQKMLNTKQVPMYPQPDPYTIFWCRTPRSWVVHHSRLQETRLHFRSSDIIWPFPPWQACFGLPNGCQEAAKQRAGTHLGWRKVSPLGPTVVTISRRGMFWQQRNLEHGTGGYLRPEGRGWRIPRLEGGGWGSVESWRWGDERGCWWLWWNLCFCVVVLSVLNCCLCWWL